ncbi:MAG: RNase adapter RapZ [Chloroflexi bacterium]|nr:RNase adapter RapZ [Chloroflexota bacterium]
MSEASRRVPGLPDPEEDTGAFELVEPGGPLRRPTPVTMPEAAAALPATPPVPTTPLAATAPPAAEPARQHVAIITGLSGAGKTATSKLFEDLGFTVVDNLPSELLREMAELVAGEPERFRRVALVLDVRAGDADVAFGAVVGALEARDIQPQVFFLEARDEVLIRRFSETRHRHPLDHSQQGVAASIAKERLLLEDVRGHADVVIDTSDLSGRQLRERIFAALQPDAAPDRLGIQLISFGFKHGVPLEADLVFDVRFMDNPFYHPDLRPLSGLTEAVRTFVLGQPVARTFLDFLEEFFDFAVPAYVQEGKTRLTVAIGCTGGFHRSIAISEALAAHFRQRDFGPVSVWHRELDRQ